VRNPSISADVFFETMDIIYPLWIAGSLPVCALVDDHRRWEEHTPTTRNSGSYGCPEHQVFILCRQVVAVADINESGRGEQFAIFVIVPAFGRAAETGSSAGCRIDNGYSIRLEAVSKAATVHFVYPAEAGIHGTNEVLTRGFPAL